MNKENYSEMSVEELRKKLKTMNFVVGLLIGALLFAFVLNVFVNKKGFWSSAIAPLSLSPIILILYSITKNIKAELKSRNN